MTDEPTTGTPRPRGRSDVVFRSVRGDWVLYDPRSEDLHVLNVTAAAVWSCCDGTLSPEGIARALTENMVGSPSLERVRRDVAGVLERFRGQGLLE